MDWLQRAAESRPEAPAVITPDRTYTYAEVDRAADAVAAIVGSSELRGAAVAFWGTRDPATVAAAWGIPRAGSVAVAVDPALPPAESMRVTRMAGARGLWAIEPGGMDVLLRRSEPFLPPKGGVPRRGEGGDEELSDDARYVVFTSGTSSRKGVILTNANIAASVAASQQRLGNGPDDPWLAVLPLYHVGGLAILWRQAAAGAPVVLAPAFEATNAAAALEEVAFTSVVPTMLHRMLTAGATAGPKLRGVLVGGGPTSRGLLRSAIDAGLPVLATYGMTETCSQVCTVAPGDASQDLGTAGRPLAGAEVAIGDGGVIRVRGPMVSPGYVGEAPRDTDWFVTGDRGRLDAAGRLVVLGRADRVIVTGGENVQPETVEAALLGLPGVSAVRVGGVPDDEWGQRLVAEVVLTGTTVAEVEGRLRSTLSRVQIPREWRVVDSLPAKLD